MRHLIAITGLLLCSQVHADPLQSPSHRKPIDYSRSHALSGNGGTAPTTQSALDELIANRTPAAAARGTTSELMNEDVATWLASQGGTKVAPAGMASAAPAADGVNTTGLADRFASLVVDAIGHIGIPYKYGGNSLEAGGFDCSGFVKAIYSEALGAILPRRSEEQAAATAKINRTELQPGDLVFFKTTRRAFSHVGIYIGEDKFVHAPRTGARIRMENMTDNYWTKRFNGARRVHVAESQAQQAHAGAGLGAY
ncbi:MAG: Murein DD-endopeptidase MepH [Paracidovorax wautersii]|uniref:Murein DD-endopeptidase MepH n=1 Tax=Paracidovorax wautersii TaxID=1177982 RepID=A0A7V8FM87_9BURK|nr:MAG: Murein DD-endopeptidase MepH [Paracidovorax wautersii]